MKKKIIALGAIALILICGSVKAAEVTKERGIISLSVTETKETEPNKAKISFSVETKASTAQKASEENNAISNKVMAALKELSDGKDNIKTSSFSVTPNYVYAKDSSRTIKSYTAYNSVDVETKDIKKVSKYIDAAISSGAQRTSNLSYSYENPSAICTELYPVLMKKLRTQADELAKSGGSLVEGIKYVNAGCNTSYNRTYRFMAKAMSVNATGDSAAVEEENSTPVEAGKVKIQVSVSAEFFVK